MFIIKNIDDILISVARIKINGSFLLYQIQDVIDTQTKKDRI